MFDKMKEKTKELGEKAIETAEIAKYKLGNLLKRK